MRLLTVLTPNLDHSRVVHQLRRAENLPLAIDYLKAVQKVGDCVSGVSQARSDPMLGLVMSRGDDFCVPVNLVCWCHDFMLLRDAPFVTLTSEPIIYYWFLSCTVGDISRDLLFYLNEIAFAKKLGFLF